MILISDFASTSESKRSKILPIYTAQSSIFVFDKIVNFLKENEYEDIKYNKTFFDIYFYDLGYEVSVLIGHDNGAQETTVNITVFRNKIFGSPKRYLKRIKNTISELLK